MGGLNTLREMFCSNTTLKRNVKMAGANCWVPASISAGIVNSKNVKKNIKILCVLNSLTKMQDTKSEKPRYASQYIN